MRILTYISTIVLSTFVSLSIAEPKFDPEAYLNSVKLPSTIVTCKNLHGYSSDVNGNIIKDKSNAGYIFTLSEKGMTSKMVPNEAMKEAFKNMPDAMKEIESEVPVNYSVNPMDGSVTILEKVDAAFGYQIKYFTLYLNDNKGKIIYTKHSANPFLPVKGGLYVGECTCENC